MSPGGLDNYFFWSGFRLFAKVSIIILNYKTLGSIIWDHIVYSRSSHINLLFNLHLLKLSPEYPPGRKYLESKTSAVYPTILRCIEPDMIPPWHKISVTSKLS